MTKKIVFISLIAVSYVMILNALRDLLDLEYFIPILIGSLILCIIQIFTILVVLTLIKKD